MKAEEIKVDFEELKKLKEQNAKDRLWFLDFWADYVKSHSGEDWGKMQGKLINSQLRSAKKIANST